MNAPAPRRRLGNPGLAVSLLLLGLLLAVNVVAVWGILAARQGARREALGELELQTAVHARSLEAALATLRGDLLFLRQSPPLAQTLPTGALGDPMAQRWHRLDVEGTLLLFLEAHPPVRRLVVAAPGAEPVVVGRSAEAPVVLPPEAGADDGQAAGAGEGGLLRGRWPIGPRGEAGTLEAAVSLDLLLAAVTPGLEGRVALVRDGAPAAAGGDGGELVALVPVQGPGWEPPLAATLVRREDAGRLLRSVEALAGRFRTTVALNVAVVALTMVLGLLAFRQVRRAARLAAEKDHQLRLRELERQLLHSERLASVGRLAAGVAHEINNPLEGMANYLTLLDEELAAGDPGAARDHGRRVGEGLERVAEIVRRLLALSSPGHGPRQRVDLGRVVAETVEFVRGAGAFPGVELRLEAAGGEGPVVLGNAVTLGQLLLNLVLNACQAMPGGGSVEVTVATEAGDGTGDGTAGDAGAGRADRALVTVADRGPGLPPEAADHLFEPFFSTRGSTGLGLAVSRGIAADHGGEIRAADRPGGGAVFAVTLPLAGAAEPSAGPEPRRGSPGAARAGAPGGDRAPTAAAVPAGEGPVR
jgi:signal transduction histidine kinase